MPRRRPYHAPVDEQTIGERIRQLRKRRGLTQTELARTVGVQQPLISQYERGELRIHGALVAAVAHALNASADEVLGLKAPAAEPATNRKLMRRLERISDLPAAEQNAVLKILDGLLKRRNGTTAGK